MTCRQTTEGPATLSPPKEKKADMHYMYTTQFVFPNFHWSSAHLEQSSILAVLGGRWEYPLQTYRLT